MIEATLFLEVLWVDPRAWLREALGKSFEIRETPRRTPLLRDRVSFPRSPWECRLPRSAWTAAALGRRSVHDGIPTQSVGTRLSRSLVSACGKGLVVLSEMCQNP